jgi:hypothetical protein
MEIFRLLRRTGIFILSIDLLSLRRLIFDLILRSGRRISRNSGMEGLSYLHSQGNRRQKEDSVKTRIDLETYLNRIFILSNCQQHAISV